MASVVQGAPRQFLFASEGFEEEPVRRYQMTSASRCRMTWQVGVSRSYGEKDALCAGWHDKMQNIRT